MTLALNRKEKQEAATYLPLIERVAHRLVRRLPSYVDVNDLISAGMLGLADAMAKFDATKETRFEEYAEWRIKGAMLDELRKCDPLTRDQRRQVNELKQATHKLETKLGRAPEEAELASSLSTDLAGVRERRERLESATPMHLETFDVLEGGAGDAEEQLMHAEARAELARAMATLPERLRAVLELSYGEELSLKEIGARLGVTESRVCQLRGEAVKELRKRMVA